MCEFCQDGWTEEVLAGNDGIIYDKKNNKYYIFAEHFAGSRTRINVNYCPECGRKLKEDTTDGCEDNFDVMDINNVKKGSKIVYINKNGHDHDRNFANKYLKEGKIYTVDYVDIGGWSSEVFLKEFPGRSFNTVMFADVK